ncbi:rRNA maturation RNase YbeY [soil metagenome]
MEQILFHYVDIKVTIKGKKTIKDIVRVMFKKEKTPLNRLDYIFCSDDYLLDINQRFLKHNYYTDIITFDLSDSKAVKGEIYISVDRVKENARLHKQPFYVEFARVIFHGALHLCDYKDKKNNEKTVMRSKEDFYLKRYSVSRGTY